MFTAAVKSLDGDKFKTDPNPNANLTVILILTLTLTLFLNPNSKIITLHTELISNTLQISAILK